MTTRPRYVWGSIGVAGLVCGKVLTYDPPFSGAQYIGGVLIAAGGLLCVIVAMRWGEL